MELVKMFIKVGDGHLYKWPLQLPTGIVSMLLAQVVFLHKGKDVSLGDLTQCTRSNVGWTSNEHNHVIVCIEYPELALVCEIWGDFEEIFGGSLNSEKRL